MKPVKPTLSNVDSEALRFSYEDLRAQVLAGGRGPGFAIFLHHGMREWIEVCCSCTAVMTVIEPVQVSRNPECIAPEMRSEIVSILAGLFVQKRWEATR